jgi:hypothetical protein
LETGILIHLELMALIISQSMCRAVGLLQYRYILICTIQMLILLSIVSFEMKLLVLVL